MKITFIESNIVLLGNFKPSLFDKLYFIKNELIKEDEFLDSSIYTSNFSKIETKNLIILIEQKKVVLVSKENKSNILQNICNKIISENNITLRTIGFNFKWFFFIDEIYSFTKSDFYIENNNILNKHFNSENTAYGYYLSKDFKNSRLKLDIKPNILKQISGDKEQNILSFDFNFHFENENLNYFKKSISEYELYKSKALEIITDYGERR